MSSILDYDFGNKLNKFVEKIPKFNIKGCFNNPKSAHEPVGNTIDISDTLNEITHILGQSAIAVPTKQAYKVAKALSSVYSMDIGMKYLVANLSTFPEEVLSYNNIEELRQSCLKQFPDSYAQEFFKKDIVRLASQNDMDIDFLTKVAATVTSQSDFDNKVKQLKFEGSDILNVDKRQFLLAHIDESLNIEDTFQCDTVVAKEEHLGYIKESHKKYMADVYKAEIFENLQRVMAKNAKFEIPEEIDFRGYEGAPLYFDVSTPEYQLLNNLNDDDLYSYKKDMLNSGILVYFDRFSDVYAIESSVYSSKEPKYTANIYEIPEEIDFRTCTASMSLKVGSDRVEYHLLANLWQDEISKDTYCNEMKNAGVTVAYNDDDTYSIEKEHNNTIDVANEHTAALDIPDEIDFSYYDGETLYFGVDTIEYKLLSELDEDAWIEYLDEMATVGVTVEYDTVDDVFEVESSLYGDVDEDEEEHEAALDDGSASHAIESVKSKIKFFSDKLAVENDADARKELATKLVELRDELEYLQNLENQTTAKKATKAYEITKEIDYREYTSAIPLRFGPNTAEYKLLDAMSTSEFNKYKKEMAKNGTSVTYDDSLDKFIVQNGVKTANKRKASDEAQEAYVIGVKAGESDAWMVNSTEDGEKQLRKHLYAVDTLSDLLSEWEQGWEQTDHWNIKYGNDIMVLQGGEYGEYISDFWEGFHNGLVKRNINLYMIGEKLLEESGGTSKNSKKALEITPATPIEEILYYTDLIDDYDGTKDDVTKNKIVELAKRRFELIKENDIDAMGAFKEGVDYDWDELGLGLDLFTQDVTANKKVAKEYYFQQEGWKVYSDGWEIEAPEGGTIWAEKDDKTKVFWLNKDNTIDISGEEFDKVYKSFKQYIRDTKGYKYYIEVNKEAISVVDVRFPIDYNNIIREEAREALDLHWDDSGYWTDSDGKAVTEDELYGIVERAYYYPSDIVSKTDKEGLSYSKLYRYFNEISVPKKHKEMEELENLGQQRLPNIAKKKADKIEKIWIVENPKASSTIEDILWETTIGGLENQFKGGLSKTDIAATFTEEAGAKELAEKLLKSKTSNKKANVIPTPANMPEQEIYTRLTNETKDALSKIQSRASELKVVRDEHLQVHGELDEAKNRLAEEKQRISAELSGYLDISGNSFTKICTALSVAETLEAQEEVILSAVTISIDKVIEANDKVIPEDAKNILDILKHMGNVADDIVIEAKEELTKMAEGVSYVRHALRKKHANSEAPSIISETLKTQIKEFVPFIGEADWKAQGHKPERYYWFLPDTAGTGWTRGGHTNNYVDFLEGLSYQNKAEVYDRVYDKFIHPFGDVEKQATIDEGKFWPWIKTSIFGAKKFYGFADRNVNSFINDYGNLVKILMLY